jgi:hypothetical protein
MTPRVPHDAANDARFRAFPLDRPRARLSLINARQAGLPGATGFEFAVADTPAEFEMAAALVARCYGWRGYATAQPASGAGETTLLAKRDGVVVGTITVRCGMRVRLQAESGFAEHVGELRRQGCRLAEYTRFAIDRDLQGGGGQDVGLAFELIQRALLLGRIALDATDCVIEVNPRHARYYQREFGFRPYGQDRLCERVGAPARLLHLNLGAQPGAFLH